MRLARLAPLVAITALVAACDKTQDSPGRGDTAVPYGGAANGQSVGPTPGYLNAAGADRNPNPNAAATAPAAAPAPAALDRRKLPNGVEVSAAPNGIEVGLIGFIQDAGKAVDKETWFNFDRLLFETGKATLKPESQEQLKNVAEILKAFPAVALKIGGYTDNTGDKAANQTLSADRAANVKAELEKLGIAADRLASEGYGDQFPVGDNATEAGRAANRRIAVRVTKK
jgi:outer membrane protein OmpA-like peptidoglycan-associated protein